MKKSLLLLGGALVLFSNSAFGWGKMGHDAIAYIAECNLTPKAKKTIEKILGHSIVYYATWMDEWRAEPGYEHTSAWHTASVDKNLVYAPRPKGDVIFALEDAIAKLQDYKQQDDSTVVMSLRCIIHFVGDMHCPVHVKYAGQKSYNVYLNGDKCSYHNVWDDQIISRSHRWGYLEYAHQLDRCTKQQINTITAGTLRDCSTKTPATAATSTNWSAPMRNSTRTKPSPSSTIRTNTPSGKSCAPVTGWHTCSTNCSTNRSRNT